MTTDEVAEVLGTCRLCAGPGWIGPRCRLINGDLLTSYVRKELAPQLRPDDILVLENLPLYSPDFNPIEMVHPMTKNELRRLELRTILELEHAFGQSLDWITRTDTLHYFQHAGYGRSAR